MMKKNFTPPMKNLTFGELFRFLWDEGIGNELSSNDEIQPWDEISLCNAFENHGTHLGESTIQSWLYQGRIISNPKRIVLAKVISGGRPELEAEWRSELLLSANRQRKVGKATETTPDSKALGVANPIRYVTDMKVCGKEHFDEGRQACSRNCSYIPTGTKMIYLSFVLSGVKKGQTFERRWYRNGQKFKDITDFYDDAWPGYTYLWNQWGHDPGNYSVRIIVNNQVATAKFVVGELY